MENLSSLFVDLIFASSEITFIPDGVLILVAPFLSLCSTPFFVCRVDFCFNVLLLLLLLAGKAVSTWIKFIYFYYV